MIADIVVRYLHFSSILVLVAVVVGQHLSLRRSMTRAEIARVQKLDIIYAVSAMLVLATGFAQWFWVGKAAEFYSLERE